MYNYAVLLLHLLVCQKCHIQHYRNNLVLINRQGKKTLAEKMISMCVQAGHTVCSHFA